MWRAEPLAGTAARHLARSSGWLWVSALLSILAVHLDLLLVNAWAAPGLAGLYALAASLALKIEIVNQSAHVVLVPTAAGLAGATAWRGFLRRGLARSAAFSLLVLAVIPFAPGAIRLLYGPAFVGATSAFYGLVAVAVLNLLFQPVIVLAYPLGQVRVLAASDALRIVVFVTAAAILIPPAGLVGAVTARGLAHLAGNVATAAPVLRALSRARVAEALPVPDRDRPPSAPQPEAR
jgi:O-antigen/teichoic acid export membrane protein